MSQVHKKCAVASTGLHLLLVLIFLGASAFHSGDGRREVRPAEGRIIQLLPPPEAQSLSPATMSSSRLLGSQQPFERETPTQLGSTAPKTRRPLPSNGVEQRPRRDTRATEVARAVERISAGLASKTSIALEFSLSDDAEAENFAQIVRDIYTRDWDTGEAAGANHEAATKVMVTIGSDGKVISAKMLKQSGESRVDLSVQRTLDRIKFIEPFGPGAKEKQRTYTINFSLRLPGE